MYMVTVNQRSRGIDMLGLYTGKFHQVVGKITFWRYEIYRFHYVFRGDVLTNSAGRCHRYA